ncbi:MAG: M20/M25/M40 family metallo-hydrolase [Planctomycetes bacterium]|nr:M20/M25/M40 family metallo-hydrolase [Planctomycetota bacterium]
MIASPRPFRLIAPAAVLLLSAWPCPAQDTGSDDAVLRASRTAPDPATLDPLPADRRQGFASIDPELCREWLTYLASDELEGRATGRPGYRLAAEFVAAKFAEWGLQPVGDDGTYFQSVPFVKMAPDLQTSWLAAVDADGTELFRVAVGSGVGGPIGENSDAIGELCVFDPAAAGDEPDLTPLRDKMVLLDGRVSPQSQWAIWRAGPKALLTVSDEAAARIDERISLDTGPRDVVRDARRRRPNGYAVSTELAQRLKDAAAAHAGLQLRAHVEVTRQPVFAANVVGLLEGSDPSLKDEIIGIGSHLDHIGVGASGDVNNGADDDGSGTTGVLAVVRAFHVNGHRPRRSILFMCFCGEEMGLIGSRHYAEHPIFPNANMIAELQMDMIGRREEAPNPERRTPESPDDNVNTLHLVGSQQASDELHAICLQQNQEHVGFVFEFDEEGMFSRSDHASFARQDIPVAFFFTGLHPQYHRGDDTVDKIDFPKLARVAQLVYSIAFELADRDERPTVDRTWADTGGGRRRR